MPNTAAKALLPPKIQVFLLAYDLRSFTQVAKTLKITQPAVSKVIGELENELGFDLFVRDSRPLTVTPEARIVHDYLSRYVGDFRSLIDSLQCQHALRPIIRLGILESLSQNLGIELVRQLNSKVSRIVIVTASGNVLGDRLMERKVDLIITNELTIDAPNLYRRKVFEEPSVFIFPKGQSQGLTSSWKSVQNCGLPFISYWRDCGAGRLNDKYFQEQDVKLIDRYSVDSNAVLVSLVAEGLGWAVARPSVLIQTGRLAELDVLPMPEPVLHRSVYVMGRNNEFEEEAKLVGEIAKTFYEKTLVPLISVKIPKVQET
mgnify:FL=1